MFTTLIVEKKPELQSFISINMLAWVGSESMCFDNAKFAMQAIESKKQKIDLIITRNQINDENTAEAFLDFLKKNNLNIPIMVLGKFESAENDQCTVLDSALDVKTLIKTSASILGVTAQDMAQLQVPDYFKIPIHFFNYLNYPVSDVYKQADLANSNSDYIHILDQMKSFDSNLISELEKQKHQSLFVKKMDRLKFVSNLNSEIVSKFDITDLNSDEKVTAMEMTQNLLHTKMSAFGINPETVELAKKNIKNMSAVALKSPSLKRLLARMLKNKSSFLYKHTQILMMVCHQIMQKIDWSTPEQEEKLQFIAFFHDIALENDEQAQIHSEEALKASKLSLDDKDKINMHAQVASTLIQKYPKAPMGAEIIIKQHHGTTNGIGFSAHCSGNLSPMAIVLIVAEELTEIILKNEDHFDFNKVLNQLREKYSTQRFKKIIDAIEQISI